MASGGWSIRQLPGNRVCTARSLQQGAGERCDQGHAQKQPKVPEGQVAVVLQDRKGSSESAHDNRRPELQQHTTQGIRHRIDRPDLEVGSLESSRLVGKIGIVIADLPEGVLRLAIDDFAHLGITDSHIVDLAEVGDCHVGELGRYMRDATDDLPFGVQPPQPLMTPEHPPQVAIALLKVCGYADHIPVVGDLAESRWVESE